MCSKIDIMNKVILSLLAIILMISACKNDPKGAQQMPPEATDPARSGEAYSMTLDGKKLMEWNEPAEIKAKNDAAISNTRTRYLQGLNDVTRYLEYAKSYLADGHVENAISILDKAAAKFENTADVFYWRGEAKIKGRQFAEANSDFWKAAKLMETQQGYKGLVRLTGIDSILNQSLHYLNYQGMGMSYQAAGELNSADKMYEVCGDFSTNPDLWTVSYYYQYQNYARSGNETGAKKVMATVDKSKQTLPPFKPYLDALLYWKGDIAEDDLVDLDQMPHSSEEARPWLIKAYALVVKAMIEKKNDKALEYCNKILSCGYWAQYPYILAESDALRIRKIQIPKTDVIDIRGTSKPN